MKNEDIIKAIAELDGWKSSKFGTEESPVWYQTTDDGMVYELPPYLTSRDAIVPVLRKQPRFQNGKPFQLLIVRHLETIVERDGKFLEREFNALVATPRQLCEALLCATGKWKE